MRATHKRWFLAVAAFAVTACPSVRAGASEVDVPAIESTFASGAAGWTATASCAPLCSVTNTIDPGPGAGSPGSATVIYTTLAGLLGGLATGTSTWKSPSFTWASATPDHATVSLARRAAVSGLLAVGGSASSRIQLDDLTEGTITTIAADGISTADTSFVTHALAIEPALLKQSHSYCLLLTTNLSAAALLSGIRVSYDDISLSGTSESGGTGSTGGTGGTGSTGGTATTPTGGGAGSGALRLIAPRVVRFTVGHAIAIRVHASRAGRAVAGIAITVRVARTTRRVSTGRDGAALVRVTPRGRAPIRISFRVGAAVAITRARLR